VVAELSFGGIYEGTKGAFPEYIRQRINEGIPIEGTYISHTIEITNINNIPLNYNPATNRLQRQVPLDLRNYFSGLAHFTSKENCVRAYLKQHYPKMSKKVIDSLGNEDGVSPQELIAFAERYNIKYIAYDADRNIIAQHIPENPSHAYKRLLFVAYDNHIYPFTHNFISKIHKHPNYVSLTEEELYQKFIDILYKEHTAPADIRLGSGNTPFSFIHDDTMYFHNPDYEAVRKVATIFGIQDKIHPRTRLSSIGFLLALRDFEEMPRSYFPYDFKKGHEYYNITPDPKRKTITIDKNKCYSFVLSELPYLITCDIRVAEHIISPNTIIPHYLYIVKPIRKSILIPRIGIYTGSYLLKAKAEGISFILLEGIQTKQVINNFGKMIYELYEKVPEHAKDILNKMIGCFTTSNGTRTYAKVARLTTRADPSEKFIPFDDNYGFAISTEENAHIYNNLPISIQIKEGQTLLVYQKMKQLKLKTEDIVQINADSFTYYSTGKPPTTGTGLHQWKLGVYNSRFILTDETIGETLTFNKQGTGTLYQGYAGNGKSTKLKSLYTDDCIILSSKHSAIRQHRAEGRNAEVIQKFQFGHPLPTQSTIFVEECWLNSRENWDIIIKLQQLGRTIIAFGDPHQCPPVGETRQLNSPLFINAIFQNVITLKENYRNDFTPEYYNQLLTTQDNTEELKKHSVPWEKSEMIICFRNEIVDKYNDMKMKHLGIEFGSPECSVICRSNNLRSKNIYNGFIFTIKSADDVISFYETDETITHEELDKYFKPAYARTIYSVQGDEFRTIHIAEEDYLYLKKPEFAYTCISRIKTSAS